MNITLTEEIHKFICHVSHRRSELKEEFIKAYLNTFPWDKNLMDVIKDLELVEQWNKKRTEVRWFLRERKK